MTHQPGSSSVEAPDYWWFAARARLLEAALAPYLGAPARLLDVGSADGPSAAWMRGDHTHVTLDLDARGLTAGRGVVGALPHLPFADGSFDVVAAFDVVEHVESEAAALDELARVLSSGGRLLVSVPAYQWAWSHHDVRAGHYRRYTRPRIVAAVERAGLTVERATYAFGAVFPLFAGQRLLQRVRSGPPAERLPSVHPVLDRVLRGASAAEARVLPRVDLPFGSSVLLAATRP
ncbi:class I SAM-dependent methyltransferase [Nocardioides bigeumensis]|uniref:Class I SAM-dependent methyltransferase n=1 Tax=Nocardioides bigeumensis TaxID=433657 RepID=A0ABN2YLG3_9ACTN